MLLLADSCLARAFVISGSMERLPASPLIAKGLDIAQRHFGMRELSTRLGSPAGTINAWRLGQTTMPQQKFHLLVDLLLEIAPTWMED